MAQIERRVERLENSIACQREQTVVWIKHFSFTEDEAAGATVRKGDTSINVVRRDGESISALEDRAIASIKGGSFIVGWLFDHSHAA